MDSDKQEKNQLFDALSLAWELGYTIAVPIVIFALLGRLIDNWLQTWPWFLLLGVFISIIISSTAVYFKTMRIIKKNEK